MSFTLKTVGVDDPVLDEVMALGDRNKKTLGFLPWAGFTQAAARAGILAAMSDDGRLAGYCLYDLPGNYVRITHVCIADEFRGQKVARFLIDSVSESHRNRLGMKLKCRTDWDANTLWPGLGFVQKTKVRGRSKKGHLLAVWWRTHGHADLFSALLDDNDGLRIAVDANVYSDLHSPRQRSGAQHSAALAPLVADQEIKIVVCACVLGELHKTPDQKLLQGYLDALDYNYESAPAAGARAEAIRDDLLQSVDGKTLDRDPSLRADALFIAEAICADVEVIVSRDENAVLQFADRALERYEVTVLNPSEIRNFLDAAESPDDYLPDQLRHTGFSTVRPQAAQWRWDSMEVFLDRNSGEKKRDFTELLRRTATEATALHQRFIVSDPAGQARAAWATQVDGAVLRVPFLRVAPGTYGPTIARLLTFHLRQVAIESDCSTIVVSDDHCPASVVAVLKTDGFTGSASGWIAIVMAACARWDNLNIDEVIGPLAPPTPDAAELERTRWPLRLLGAGISNYLVPIRGSRSADLLGYPVTLDARPDFLGLSREHVYYKAAGGIHLQTPGRILWFASKNPQEVIGCSRLVETITGAPNSLHRQFSRFGVYSANDVRSAAGHNGLVEVLRFADTELFDKKVTLDRLMHLAEAHSKSPNLVLQSAHRIDDEMFELIYREGTGR